MQYLANPGTFLLAVLFVSPRVPCRPLRRTFRHPSATSSSTTSWPSWKMHGFAVDLAKSDFAAYEKIFKMIEGLQEAGTIPHMDYLKAKYDRDAAKLALEASDLILVRQAALVEQYRLICNKTGSGSGPQERASSIRKAHARYRQADCSSLAKAIEVAATRLEFNREFLKKTIELRREKFATNTQVILAELDVDREEKSLADAKRRTATCSSELAAK